MSHELEKLPYDFTKEFPDRQVNSIYFDDPSFSNAHANIAGISSRSKYRIRWYGQDVNLIKQPVLEQKVKENQLGYKEYHQLPNFNLINDLQVISQDDRLLNLDLLPVVSVHYKRSYLRSFHKKIRATIDREIKYRLIGDYTLSKQKMSDNVVVLEIKYDVKHADLADQVLNSLPFRITKNSKYLSAIEAAWF